MAKFQATQQKLIGNMTMKYSDYIAMFDKLEKLEKAYAQAWKDNASKAKLARLANQLNKLDKMIASKKGYIYS